MNTLFAKIIYIYVIKFTKMNSIINAIKNYKVKVINIFNDNKNNYARHIYDIRNL